MADAEDDQWDVNEENLLMGSEILANDHHHYDHDSSSATSYSASVTNSPAGADLHRRSADLEQ